MFFSISSSQSTRLIRARLFATLIAESNCGKSPFFRQCLDGVFVSHSSGQCLVDWCRGSFVGSGPGKDDIACAG